MGWPRMSPEMSGDAACGVWHCSPEAAAAVQRSDAAPEEGAVGPGCPGDAPAPRTDAAEDSDSDISVGRPSPKPCEVRSPAGSSGPSASHGEGLTSPPTPRTPTPTLGSGSGSSKFPEDGMTSNDSAMSPPPAPPTPSREGGEDEYFKPLKKLRMVQLQQQEEAAALAAARSSAGVKSFSITEILSHKPVVARAPDPPSGRIVRPWDTDDDEDMSRPQSVDDMSVSSASSSGGSPRPASSDPGSGGGSSQGSQGGRPRGKDGNPLDALFQMTSKTFEGLKPGQQAGEYKAPWSREEAAATAEAFQGE